MVIENNDLLEDEYEGEDAEESTTLPLKTLNIDARRRLEALKEERELQKLLMDDFDLLDDIA